MRETFHRSEQIRESNHKIGHRLIRTSRQIQPLRCYLYLIVNLKSPTVHCPYFYLPWYRLSTSKGYPSPPGRPGWHRRPPDPFCMSTRWKVGTKITYLRLWLINFTVRFPYCNIFSGFTLVTIWPQFESSIGSLRCFTLRPFVFHYRSSILTGLRKWWK